MIGIGYRERISETDLEKIIYWSREVVALLDFFCFVEIINSINTLLNKRSVEYMSEVLISRRGGGSKGGGNWGTEGGEYRIITFTESTNWIVPQHVIGNNFKYIMIGGGGGAGGYSGGGGGYVNNGYVRLAPGESVAITVGAGGICGNSLYSGDINSNGGSGGASSIGTVVSANGGGGGLNRNGGSGGSGGGSAMYASNGKTSHQIGNGGRGYQFGGGGGNKGGDGGVYGGGGGGGPNYYWSTGTFYNALGGGNGGTYGGGGGTTGYSAMSTMSTSGNGGTYGGGGGRTIWQPLYNHSNPRGNSYGGYGGTYGGNGGIAYSFNYSTYGILNEAENGINTIGWTNVLKDDNTGSYITGYGRTNAATVKRNNCYAMSGGGGFGGNGGSFCGGGGGYGGAGGSGSGNASFCEWFAGGGGGYGINAQGGGLYTTSNTGMGSGGGGGYCCRGGIANNINYGCTGGGGYYSNGGNPTNYTYSKGGGGGGGYLTYGCGGSGLNGNGTNGVVILEYYLDI